MRTRLKARDYMLYAYPVVSADHYAQGIGDTLSLYAGCVMSSRALARVYTHLQLLRGSLFGRQSLPL